MSKYKPLTIEYSIIEFQKNTAQVENELERNQIFEEQDNFIKFRSQLKDKLRDEWRLLSKEHVHSFAEPVEKQANSIDYLFGNPTDIFLNKFDTISYAIKFVVYKNTVQIYLPNEPWPTTKSNTEILQKNIGIDVFINDEDSEPRKENGRYGLKLRYYSSLTNLETIIIDILKDIQVCDLLFNTNKMNSINTKGLSFTNYGEPPRRLLSTFFGDLPKIDSYVKLKQLIPKKLRGQISDSKLEQLFKSKCTQESTYIFIFQNKSSINIKNANLVNNRLETIIGNAEYGKMNIIPIYLEKQLNISDHMFEKVYFYKC